MMILTLILVLLALVGGLWIAAQLVYAVQTIIFKRDAQIYLRGYTRGKSEALRWRINNLHVFGEPEMDPVERSVECIPREEVYGK